MTSPLLDKTVLVTGASRGIGRAIALQMAEMGANIALNYVRNEEAAEQTAREIRAKGRKCLTLQANVGDPKAARAMIDTAASEFEAIDVLVHNAAMGAFKPVHKLKANQWDLSLEINTKAFLTLVQQALPWMEGREGASVIALSSLGAQRFIPNYGAIGVSKAALETLVRYLAVELAPKGIRVNAVSGGLVDTDAIRFFPDYESLRKEVIQRTPAGRLGKPEDLARVAAFLALPESSWIVGQTLIADGGLSLL